MFCNLIFCVPHYSSLIKRLLKGNNPYYFVLLENPQIWRRTPKDRKLPILLYGGYSIFLFLYFYSIFSIFIFLWERDAEKLVSVMPSIFCLFAFLSRGF